MSLSYPLLGIKMHRFYQNLFACILATITLEVCCQCCLSFDGNRCIGCPAGMFLSKGNCIYKIPNCAQYFDDFYCNRCAQSYVSTSNRRNCILKTDQIKDSTGDTPNKGFRTLSKTDQLDRSIQIIFNASKKYFEKQNIRSIIKVYIKQYNNQQEETKYSPNVVKLYRYYRFIFLCSRSLIQAIFLYTEPNNLSVKEQLRILFSKSFYFSDKERDAGWASDPYKDKISNQIKQRYPSFVKHQMIYGVKYKQRTSPSIGPAYTYRVFVTVPNPYLEQISVTILVNTSSLSTIKQEEIAKNATLKQILDKISLPTNFSIGDLTIADYLSETLYNLTLIDRSNNVSQQSYFYLIFLVSSGNLPIFIQFSEPKDQLLSLQLGEESSDKNFSAFITVSDPRLRIIPNWFLKKGLPNNYQIGSDFEFVELLDVDDFINSNVFRIGFRTVSITYYASQFLQESIVRAVIGQNSTMLIYQTAYETVNPKRQLIYYIFSITKEYRQFQMIKIYIVSRKDWEVFNINNDSSRQQSLQRIGNRYQQFMPIIDEVQKTRLQLRKSQIFSVRIERYVNNKSESVTNFFVKYYIVNKELMKKELKENKANINGQPKFEYLEIRYEAILDSTSKRYLGQVFIPFEVFSPVRNISQFRDYLTLAYTQFKDQNLSSLEASVSKSNPKRFKFTINKSKYLIDEFQNLIILSSQTEGLVTESVRVQSNRSNRTQVEATETLPTTPSLNVLKVETKIIQPQNNQASLTNRQQKTIKADQSQKSVGKSKLQQNFPSKTLKSLWKQPYFPNYLSFINFIQQYTNAELRRMISKFVRVLEKEISQIEILNHETLYYILDSYTIRFLQSSSTNNTFGSKKILIFHVPRKIYQNIEPLQKSRFLQAQKGQGAIKVNLAPNEGLQTKLKTFLKDSKIKILSSLFNRQFIRLNQDKLLNNPVIISSTIEALEAAQALDKFIQQAPEIAPIFYSQSNKTNQKMSFQLSEPKIFSQSTLNNIRNDPLLKKSLNDQLLDFLSERRIQNSPQLSMLNLNHQYFGQIRTIYSEASNKISDIYFLDEGYQIKTNDSSIMLSIPEVIKVCLNSSNQINKILNMINYTEGGKPKNVTQTDVVYWKVKKINSILQYQFVYELQGYIITSGAIVKPQKAQKSQIFLTNLEIIPNNLQKRRAEQKKSLYFNQLRSLPEFIQTQIKINATYGHYLKDFLIANITVVSNNSQSSLFSVTYLGKNLALNTVAQYNYGSKQAKVTQFKTVQRKQLYGEGCKYEKQNKVCEQCYSGYTLSKRDSRCYKLQANCAFQSNQLCLQCTQNYILRNYECI